MSQPLQNLEGINLQEYKNSVIERFANPYIKDTLARICEFTSDRIPGFNLPALHEQLQAGQPGNRFQATALILASWLVYALGVDESGNKIDIVDARKALIMKYANQAKNNPRLFMSNKEIWGNLTEHSDFMQVFESYYFKLKSEGSKSTIQYLLALQ